MSDSLWPHELQHARLPCPSPTPGVHSDSRPLSRWCHPAISSSVVPFSSCPESLPASGSFQMSQLFASGGQSIGVSASTSVLPMNIQDWFPLRLTGLISLQSKGLSEIKKCDASSFILFIQNCFAMLLWFHTNYRIFFLLLLKNIIGILIVIALKSVDQSSIFG